MSIIPAGRNAPSRCIVVGASARAFAESAARAGWLVHAADMFGDTDLRSIAIEAVRVASYPRDLPDAVSRFPVAAVVCTGALENHPAVIEALARDRPLAGCDPRAIRGVRDPGRLATVVRDAGLSFPDTITSSTGLSTDGSFLVKPRASAGGRGIRPWRGAAASDDSRDILWQRFVRGTPWSAAWIAGRGRATLVGASRPLRGGGWCGCRRFAYCGSIDVPTAALPVDLRRSFEALGARLTAAFGLVGAFGSDVIVTAAGDVHVLEVNPRPTASMELVERATGWSLAAAHLAARTDGAGPSPAATADGVWGKAIAFVPRGPIAGALPRILAAADPWTRADGASAIADIPAADAPLVPGTPLLTVFARGPNRAAVAAELRSRVTRLRRLVGDDVSRRDGDRSSPRPRRARTA